MYEESEMHEKSELGVPAGGVIIVTEGSKRKLDKNPKCM